MKDSNEINPVSDKSLEEKEAETREGRAEVLSRMAMMFQQDLIEVLVRTKLSLILNPV